MSPSTHEAALGAQTARARRLVCTWMIADDAEDDGHFHQVPVGRSSGAAFQATYWRCVAVFFATARMLDTDAELVLFTNVREAPTVDGVDLTALLDRLGARVVVQPLTFRTPPDYYDQWRNQFYVFDIVRRLAGELADDDLAVVLDSDCVWANDPAPLWDALAQDGALTYDVGFSPDHVTNGLDRRELATIGAELGGVAPDVPLAYCGGEFLAASGREMQRILAEALWTWDALLARHAQGLPTYNEEGQTLSYIYARLGYRIGNGDPFVRRMWTGNLGVDNNIVPVDAGRVIWHMPLEKRYGMYRLFRRVADPADSIWSLPPGPELTRHLGSIFGIPRTGPAKLVRDTARRVTDRLRYR